MPRRKGNNKGKYSSRSNAQRSNSESQSDKIVRKMFTQMSRNKERLPEERLPEERLLNERLSEERSLEERSLEEQLLEERLLKKQLLEEQLLEEQLLEERLLEEEDAKYNFYKIKDVISYVKPVKESTNDFKYITTDGYKIKQCSLCGARSGTALIIPHYFACPYGGEQKELEYISDNITINNLSGIMFYPIMQRQIGIVESNGQAMLTFGVGPCVVLIMRNRNTGHTALAHIDQLTTGWDTIFYQEFPNRSDIDIYLFTSDTQDIFLRILQTLDVLGYTTLVYISVLQNNLYLMFGIDPSSGILYVDDCNYEYIKSQFSIPINEDERKMYGVSLRMKDELTVIYPPALNTSIPI